MLAKNLDDLMIYKQCMELIYYTERITQKYPKSEKSALVANIKTITYKCMEDIIKAQKEYNYDNRMDVLNDMDIKLKMLKVFVRISYKDKYINGKNYEAWSLKINNICNLLGGWIKSCQKH